MSLGFYRVEIGDFACTVINEGTFPPDDDWIQDTFRSPVGRNPLEFVAEYERDFGPYHFSMSPLLIEAGGRRILVDTATGDYGPPPLRGQVIKQLNRAGTPPEAIDTLLISHLDEDHYQGTFSEDGQPRFPNAQILVGEVEYQQRANQDPENPARYEEFHDIRERRQFLDTIAGNMTLVNPGDEIAPGVTLVQAYGHRPGQLGVLVRSGDAGFLYMADAAHAPMQFRHPALDIRVQYDHVLALNTRMELFGMAADEGLIVTAYHFGFPGVGRVERDGEAFRWLPLR